jgi:hypothetical protein
MRTKRLLAAAICAVAFAAVGAGSAFAGEITGPSTPTGGNQDNPTAAPDHANSICAFSGLNHAHEGEVPTRVQSYGQIVAAGGKADVPSPGVACNGHTGFLSGG